MNVLITCGPSYEPIDQARRLTNFSTGQLGVTLANALVQAGCVVHCFKGSGSTYPGPLFAQACHQFDTNDDLAHGLEEVSRQLAFDAVFHAAALCDYRVEKMATVDGQTVRSRKFATRDGSLILTLVPALKVLPKLRDWFPHSRIVGWKYELEGTSVQALDKGWRQISENRTDACVVNGAAYGLGFGFCTPPGHVLSCPDSPALCRAILSWLAPPASQAV